MIILGAGLSGLLAGALIPSARIYEAAPQGQVRHGAVLRMRSPKIGETLGIPFKRVVVRKAIFSNGEEVQPSIYFNNKYSQKVVGGVYSRSISDTRPVERYVPPVDFQSKLIDMCSGRLAYNSKCNSISDSYINIGKDFDDRDCPVISTLPMLVNSKLTGLEIDFDLKKPRIIHTARLTIPSCDVHQTIYYPTGETCVYRATIEGEVLIIESMAVVLPSDVDMVCSSIGIPSLSYLDADTSSQSGKIVSVSDVDRKNFIHKLTTQLNVYSLGRFAVCKNILLDDVFDDIKVVKMLIQSGSDYDAKRRMV